MQKQECMHFQWQQHLHGTAGKHKREKSRSKNPIDLNIDRGCNNRVMLGFSLALTLTHYVIIITKISTSCVCWKIKFGSGINWLVLMMIFFSNSYLSGCCTTHQAIPNNIIVEVCWRRNILDFFNEG
jgi:hypothetical protein